MIHRELIVERKGSTREGEKKSGHGSPRFSALETREKESPHPHPPSLTRTTGPNLGKSQESLHYLNKPSLTDTSGKLTLLWLDETSSPRRTGARPGQASSRSRPPANAEIFTAGSSRATCVMASGVGGARCLARSGEPIRRRLSVLAPRPRLNLVLPVLAAEPGPWHQARR